MKALRIAVILLVCLAFTVTTSTAGGKKKTKVRYKCWSSGERVVCPDNFKQSSGFKEYLRQKRARLHDTSRQYYTDEDRENTSERTYYDESPRTYYDETIKEQN